MFWNNLFINPTKTHCILFQTKQRRQESKLKILIKTREIVKVKSTNFLEVTIDSNLSWEVHIERTCSRISDDLFIIKRLYKILDQNVRRMFYYGLIYSFLSYGIAVWGQSAKELTRRIFTFHKRAVRYTAGLKQLEFAEIVFRHLKILKVYLLYIKETILYAKEKCNCTK
jgi:hypothetical protein